jgi:hypothetical protein
MQRTHGNVHLLIGHADAHTRALQRFDLRRPLIDDRDVMAALREIRPNAAAYRARTQHYYFPLHMQVPS